MSNTSVDTLHSRWTIDLAEQIPYVEGARIKIIDGELYVTSALPNWTTDIVEQMPHLVSPLLPGFACPIDCFFNLLGR